MLEFPPIFPGIDKPLALTGTSKDQTISGLPSALWLAVSAPDGSSGSDSLYPSSQQVPPPSSKTVYDLYVH